MELLTSAPYAAAAHKVTASECNMSITTCLPVWLLQCRNSQKLLSQFILIFQHAVIGEVNVAIDFNLPSYAWNGFVRP